MLIALWLERDADSSFDHEHELKYMQQKCKLKDSIAICSSGKLSRTSKDLPLQIYTELTNVNNLSNCASSLMDIKLWLNLVLLVLAG